MTSKEAHNILFSGPVGYTLNEYNEASNVIYKSLERLETLEKENKKWREIVGCDLCEALGREILLEENKKLKKALDEACKILSWDCPCCQDLIDDLDCENRCQPDIDYSECWMKYFIKEVLGND